MTVAEVGDIVEFYDGLRGRVEKINDNSVIVNLKHSRIILSFEKQWCNRCIFT